MVKDNIASQEPHDKIIQAIAEKADVASLEELDECVRMLNKRNKKGTKR